MKMRTDSTGIKSKSADASAMQLEIKPETPSNKSENVVLAGNPNVGKSLVFNYLSGTYVDVSNFPGTTVSVSEGKYKNHTILDTPGVYGVSSFNEEETVTRDILLEADVILNVVNALHLERDLFLTLQLIDLGKPVSVILNFYDEVKKKKIKIDTDALSKLLGVKVFTTSAITKTGFENLDAAIAQAVVSDKIKTDPSKINLEAIQQHGRAIAQLVAEGDDNLARKYQLPYGTPDERELIYLDRRQKVNEIVNEVEYQDDMSGKFFNRLGRWTLNPLTGIPILGLVLVMLYYAIGDFAAQRLVGYTEGVLGKGIFEFYTKSFVGNFTPVEITVNTLDANEEVVKTNIYDFKESISADPVQKDKFFGDAQGSNKDITFEFKNPVMKLLFGEFGIFSMTITYLIFLLLPLVVCFYFVMAFLEDSGYLPRLATMMDRSLSAIGLNGKAIIPILLGFGCVTMATITTRILGSSREKSIATAILQFVIPCSAQLAVIAALTAKAGPGAVLVYGGVIFAMMITISTILNRFLPGESTPLLIDLPPMRIPRLDNILKKMVFRTWGFLKEAGVWFFIGALFVAVLDITGMLVFFQNLLQPVTTGWLKLPGEASTAFVMGVVRRDFGGAGLYDLALAPMQVAVALIVITLFVPCIASFMVMINERGWKEGLLIWFGAWIIAFLVGGLTAQIVI